MISNIHIMEPNENLQISALQVWNIVLKLQDILILPVIKYLIVEYFRDRKKVVQLENTITS